MRLIHTSDVHIDSPLTTRLSGDKLSERRNELRSNFRRLTDLAEQYSASAVIIAGDLFDEGRVSSKLLTRILDTVSSHPKITFFYLGGNHEGDVLRESGATLPPNLLFFEKEWTYFKADGVTIAGRTDLSENMFDTLTLPEDTKNIVVLHGELRDRSSSDGAIGLKDMKEKNIDYLALGHYHSYSVTEIDQRGIAVYSGTPEGRGFDETGDKGVVLIDCDGKRITESFIPFAKRRLHIVGIDISDVEKFAETELLAKNALRGIPSEDMVRLELCGSYSPALWKDSESLCQKFGHLFYYFEVKDSSKPRIDPEEFKHDKSLKGEFIRLVMADDSITDEMKAKIISCGINALMGEELFGE